MEEIIQKFKKEKAGIIEFFKNELRTIRSNRPHPGLLENIRVEYYNSNLPLKQMGTIQVVLPNSLIVEVWDKNALNIVAKAIEMANLGLTTAIEGIHIRVILPPLSEERRQEIISLVHKKAEENRINFRRVRDEAVKEVKKLFDAKKIGEDDKFRKKEEIQKMVDEFNEEISSLIDKKEEELKQ